MGQTKEDAVPVRMPDGKVLLTVPEAAKLWRDLGHMPMSAAIYRRRCRSGELAALGVEVSEGPRFLTDLDSLLSYFAAALKDFQERVEAAIAERQRYLETLARTGKPPGHE